VKAFPYKSQYHRKKGGVSFSPNSALLFQIPPSDERLPDPVRRPPPFRASPLTDPSQTQTPLVTLFVYRSDDLDPNLFLPQRPLSCCFDRNGLNIPENSHREPVRRREDPNYSLLLRCSLLSSHNVTTPKGVCVGVLNIVIT